MQHGDDDAGASTGVKEGHRGAGREHGSEEGFRRGLRDDGVEASAVTNFVGGTVGDRGAALDLKPADLEVSVLSVWELSAGCGYWQSEGV